MNRPRLTARLVALCLGIVGCWASRGLAESVAELPAERPTTQSDRSHWAYRQLAAPVVPQVSDACWGQQPIDCFLRAAMQAAGVEPLPPAGKATLLRRVCFDLIGLPPTAEQVRDFLADDRPDAYERLVDQLLASPAYGERYAQHWLDLARFADTDGFEHDLVRPNAWRYRDWVIDALNRDLPFDEFVRLQVAGDLLRPGDPEAAIATGFLLCGPDMPDLNLPDERRHVVLNEITSTVGAVLLGMQLGCAQCHDHKFDPISQHDFYRLRAYFEDLDIFHDHPVPSAAELAARRAAEAAVDPKFARAETQRRGLESTGRQRFREQNPDVQPGLKQILDQLTELERSQYREASATLKQAPRLPELPLGRVVRSGQSRTAHLYLRGDFRQPAGQLASAVPAVLAAQAVPGDRDVPITTRVELAQWLVGRDNALAARVIANRLWQWHFGQPLSANPNDLGVMGQAPAQHALLDWLAERLIEEDWSLKRMHRLLVTSQAYRAAATAHDFEWNAEQTARAQAIWQRSQAIDPTGALAWRRTARRLDGESLRDAMLLAAGQLSRRRGGPGVRPPLAAEVTATLLKDQWRVSGGEQDHRRRSIYLFVRRNLRYPLFDVFDRPDTNASCALRHESTTAVQSLSLLNSPFSWQCARWLAASLAAEQGNDAARQIAGAYVRVLGRLPTADERSEGLAFLAQGASPRKAEQSDADAASATASREQVTPLVAYCLALFNASEFVYVD